MVQWLRKNGWIVLCIVLGFMVSFCGARAKADTAKTLRQGVRGPEVIQVQEWLITLGYLSGEPTGYFGELTSKAVQSFQKEHQLRSDGVVGDRTLKVMREAVHHHFMRSYKVSDGETADEIAERFNISATELLSYNGLQPESGLAPGQVLHIPPQTVASRGRASVELASWEKASQWIPIGSIFRVIDVETGLTFRVYRRGGHFHADSEPLSPADTAILFAIYGGRWSWERRAVLVEVGGRRLAGSINGMPHGEKTIAGNNFEGHFCLHFQGSRIHKTGRMDQEHQQKVLQAAGMLRIQSE